MDSISNNLEEVKAQLPANVSLVAVSKTKPNSVIEAAYSVGQRVFGENRIQELVAKSEELPKDIEWHMIGHLQSKKVKKIAPFVELIHSVDSLKLLTEINKQAKNNNRTISCLLQFHIAEEESKYGFNLDEVISIIDSKEFNTLNNVKIEGVMGMATFTIDEKTVRNEFKILKSIHKEINKKLANCKIISMGMSNDFHVAIRHGATWVRVGRGIFGARG